MMTLLFTLLMQNGATLAEHNPDIYPVLGFVIVTLLGVIAWGMRTLISLVKARMDEIKGMLDEHLKSDNAYRIDVEKRFGHHETRIVRLEDRAGINGSEA